jgi:hypothetical protein
VESRRAEPRAAPAAAQPARGRTTAAERTAGAAAGERRAREAPRRSSRRTAGIVLGGLLLLAVIAAGVVALLGGSSSKSPSKTSASTVPGTTTSSTTHHKASKPAKSSGGAATSAADTRITVLNGTETTGLAHQVSTSLQQRGYSQAEALAGRPPGANQTTVVEYTSGHQSEAEAVARSLAVTQVQPLESAAAALAGSAKVVVIVGLDKATTVP